MIANTALHRVRTGDATPQEARTAIRELIAKEGNSAAPALYTALRAWTWKALQNRRFDDELNDWFRVISGAAAALSKKDGVTAHYVEALAHLVDESIRYGESHTRNRLIARSHVGDILEVIRRHNGRMEREAIEQTAGLSKSRLSQILSELVIAGALDREAEGRHATFVLTDSGRELLDGWKRLRDQDAGEAEDDARKVRRFDIPVLLKVDIARKDDFVPVVPPATTELPKDHFQEAAPTVTVASVATGQAKRKLATALDLALETEAAFALPSYSWVREREHA